MGGCRIRLLALVACSLLVKIHAYSTFENCPGTGQELSRNICCEPTTFSNSYLLMPYIGWCCKNVVNGVTSCFCKPEYISTIQQTQPTCALGSTPLNGGWSSWSQYGTCSATCGTSGSQTRTRSCTNPVPANGGATCPGSSFETVSCPGTPCPIPIIDGGWGPWSAYGSCSVSCGFGGQQTRTRLCNNPTPANGGAPCPGNSFETLSCSSAVQCAVNGNWGPWSSFGTCSVSCGGGGSQTRTRTCTNPAPANGGATCPGTSSETQSCSGSTSCPVDGSWSQWAPYGACSVSCGTGGSQTRTRTCTNPAPANGGAYCPGSSFETQSCSGSASCPVDGVWSQWSNFGACSATCGTSGTQTRTRTCTNPAPSNGGLYCPGSSFESIFCSGSICPLDGNWGAWTTYSACSVSCGTGGTLTRTRTCNNPAPMYGGAACPGSSSDTQPCSGSTTCPLDGNWSSWSGYSACSVTCGTGGQQTRSRTCTNPPPSYGGATCYGNSIETIACSGSAFCIVDGNWGSWSPYSACSVTCGSGGTQTRTRSCNNPAPAYGGMSCPGSSSETLSCSSSYPCFIAVNGNWAPWSAYSSCSVTCGSGGTQIRYRACSNPYPANGGADCIGNTYEFVPCSGTFLCANLDGNWSPWSTYSPCSVSCGAGTQTHTRTCSNPPPSSGGASCPGVPTESIPCYGQSCLVNGNWGAWTSYTTCSVTCGSGGIQIRSRICNGPYPANGGSDCPGLPYEITTCSVAALCVVAVNGNWGAWSSFGACSATCGNNGLTIRTRSCDSPVPANGGAYCAGSSFESQPCPGTVCPVNGGWSTWSPYGACSTTCGNSGTKIRTRTCTYPVPAYGGAMCVGSPVDSPVSCPGTFCPLSQCQVPARMLNSFVPAAPSVQDGVVGILFGGNNRFCNGVFAWDYTLNRIVLYTTSRCKRVLDVPTATIVMEGILESDKMKLSPIKHTDSSVTANNIVKYTMDVYFEDYINEVMANTSQVPACVFNPTRMSSLVIDTSNCYMTSWGADTLSGNSTYPFLYPVTAKSIPVRLVASNKCAGIATGDLCFENTSTTMCYGDEAAPVFCTVGMGQYVLYGLLNGQTATSCDNNKAIVYPVNI